MGQRVYIKALLPQAHISAHTATACIHHSMAISWLPLHTPHSPAAPGKQSIRVRKMETFISFRQKEVRGPTSDNPPRPCLLPEL